MGIPVMVLGTSGTGKSASMRFLPIDKFGLINVSSKPLPFKTEKTKGIINTDDYTVISMTLKKATSDIIVIDDCQYLMANEFMRRGKETGFQKFTDIGTNFWNLVRGVYELPKQKVVYFMGHTEIDQYGNVKFKTVGKLLDEKITVEGMFTIVLRTVVQDGKYYFSTGNDGMDTVKTPMGLFKEPLIDNDLNYVDQEIRKYYDLLPKAENALV
jgi:hypothetical protein